MNTVNLAGEAEAGLVEEIKSRSGTDVRRCLQCGKCSAGCPMSFMYDLSVSQIMGLARQALGDRILAARSIWLCASCHTCSSRCPAGIDPAGVMETLRHMARQEKQPGERPGDHQGNDPGCQGSVDSEPGGTVDAAGVSAAMVVGHEGAGITGGAEEKTLEHEDRKT